jgi:hypothetical protein
MGFKGAYHCKGKKISEKFVVLVLMIRNCKIEFKNIVQS